MSWVIVRKADSVAVAETYSRVLVASVNRSLSYVAIPVGRYLAVFNARVKAAGGVQPAPAPWEG